MNELKEGAIARIMSVLSVYGKAKDLSFQEKLILKEYKKALLIFSDGYLLRMFYRLIKYGIVMLIGFALFLFIHEKFNYFN